MSEEDKTAETGETGETGEESTPAPEEESTATFEPVVKLEEVDTQSGEENEEAIYSQRSKLYVYGETMLDKGTGNKSWIERGIGVFRILKHKEHGKLRLLMRQEKTMKVICNHVLDPRIKLEEHQQSDRSWIWVAYDFSDATELVETIFCIKFGDSDIANTFRQTFQDCQSTMKDLLASEETTTDAAAEAAAEETAEKLAELSTKAE